MFTAEMIEPKRVRRLLVSGELVRWYVRSARHPLKQKVLGRYWSVFCSRPWWIRYGDDQVILTNLHDYIQQKIFFDGYYESELVEWLRAELRPADVFWDVGANIGAMTLVASPCCRTVIAFEPEPRTLEHLRVNLAANKLQNVVIHDLALSDREGTVEMCPGPNSNTGMNSICRTVSDRPTIPIRTVRADTLIVRDGVPPPNVMKIDVEGAEELVFRGAPELLASPDLRAVVFEAQDDGRQTPTNPGLVTTLEGYGFRVRPFGRSDAQTKDGMNNFLAERRS